MDTQQLFSENAETTILSDKIPGLTSSVVDMLAPFIILSLVLSIIFIALHIISMIRRRKLENALFDIQNNLREMNEREKARTKSNMPSPQPGTSNQKIAATEPRNETLSETV